MRRRRHQLQVSTFPFLAVLLCAMGSLILLLLIMDRRARAVARAHALHAAMRADEEDARLAAARAAELERRRQALHALLQQQDRDLLLKLHELQGKERAVLADVGREQAKGEELNSRLRAEAGRLEDKQRGVRRRKEEVEKQAQLSEASRRELTRLTAELLELEQTLADLKELRQRERQTYSVIPYRGKRGDNRRPLYVECTATGLVFHPDRATLNCAGLSDTDLRSEVQKRIARQPSSTADKTNPGTYLLMLVRPDGIRTYYQAMAALHGLEVDFGYEFVESDWALDFPTDDGVPNQPWMMADQAGSYIAPGPRPPSTPAAKRPVGVVLNPALVGARGTGGLGGAVGPAGLPGSGIGVPGYGGGGGSTTGTTGQVAAPGPQGNGAPATGPPGFAGGVESHTGVIAGTGGTGSGMGMGGAGAAGPDSNGSGQVAGANPGTSLAAGNGGVRSGSGAVMAGSGLSASGSAGPGGGPSGGNRAFPGGPMSVARGNGNGAPLSYGAGGGPFAPGTSPGSGSMNAAGQPGGTAPGTTSATGDDKDASHTTSVAGVSGGSANGGGAENGVPGLTSSVAGGGAGGASGSPELVTAAGFSASGGARGATGKGAGGNGGAPSGGAGGGAGQGGPGGALGQPGAGSDPLAMASLTPPAGASGPAGAPAPGQPAGRPNAGPAGASGPGGAASAGGVASGGGMQATAGSGGSGGPGGGDGGDPDVSFGGNNSLDRLLPAGLQRKASRPGPVRPRPVYADRDWPIYLDCKAQGVFIQNNLQLIPLESLGNSADNALLKSLQQLIDRRQARVADGEPPYRPLLRFRVYADGLRAYYLAYPVLGRMNLPMTREDLKPDEEVNSERYGRVR